MRILIIFLVLGLFNVPKVEARKKIICSSYYLYYYLPEVEVLPMSTDKLKHCSISCMMARKCPEVEVDIVGIFKELMDLIGPGDSELADIQANRTGISFAPLAKKRNDCIRLCRQVY